MPCPDSLCLGNQGWPRSSEHFILLGPPSSFLPATSCHSQQLGALETPELGTQPITPVSPGRTLSGKGPQTSKPTPPDVYLLVLAAEGNWGQSCEQTALEPLEASFLSQLLLPSISLNVLYIQWVLLAKERSQANHLSSLPRETPSPWEDKAWSWPQPPTWLLQLPLELCFVAHHPVLIPLRPEPLLLPSSLSSPCKCLLCPCTQALKTQTQGRRWTF